MCNSEISFLVSGLSAGNFERVKAQLDSQQQKIEIMNLEKQRLQTLGLS